MIQLIHVSKSFQSHVVLRDINFTIPDGKITVILGPSGTGKSVLLKHIIGLIRPDRGQVIVDGTDLAALDERALNHFRDRFGMLFQSAALFDSMMVGENVAFPLREHTRFSPEEIDKRVLEKLSQVGLDQASHKMPSELSGGMRKRVGLARAIALEPSIILYDEPTTGLDPLMTESINRLIVDVHKRGNRNGKTMTSVIISHDIESTFQIADQVAVLHEGQIAAQGTPDEIQDSRHPFVQRFLKKTV